MVKRSDCLESDVGERRHQREYLQGISGTSVVENVASSSSECSSITDSCPIDVEQLGGEKLERTAIVPTANILQEVSDSRRGTGLHHVMAFKIGISFSILTAGSVVVVILLLLGILVQWYNLLSCFLVARIVYPLRDDVAVLDTI